ncbi:hypothetical protein CQA61_30060, partial [Klebsiella pneumoniae]
IKSQASAARCGVRPKADRIEGNHALFIGRNNRVSISTFMNIRLSTDKKSGQRRAVWSPA